MSMAKKIPDLSDNQIEQVFSNVLNILAKAADGKEPPEKIAAAKRVLEAIEQEWAKRAELAGKGVYKAERPEKGILATLGYHVGNEGVSLSKRRKILDFILTRNLPVVQSPAYMQQWGAPGSPERLWKLASTIAYLAREKRSFKNESYAKAILEWEADMDWLYQEYYLPGQYAFKWPAL